MLFRSYGKTSEEALKLFNNLKDIEATGAWGIELECVPADLVEELTLNTKMLTISIGSGQNADAQFLFAEDILGQSQIQFPRHAKQYANFDNLMQNLQKERVKAFKEFQSDVKKNKFPTKKHSISLEKKELINFKKFLNNQKVSI